VPKIYIVGLGPGDISMLSLGTYKLLKKANHLYLRTKDHPVVEELNNEGITFTAFDQIYEKHDTFEAVYEEIVSTLQQSANQHQEIFYAVPGHPMVAERAVQLLLEKANKGDIEVEIMGGQSFIDPMLAALQVDPVEGFLLLDAMSLKPSLLQPACVTVITQVYDALIASEVKLTLMEVYPADYPVTIATAVGIKGVEELTEVPLYELDRATSLSNLTAVYVPKTDEDKVIDRRYERSRDIFRQLRGPSGCPWDKKQTHQSLKKYLLEEANEVIEAIDREDDEHLVEELGDILLQVFLHAQIAEDEGFFNMEDVIQSLNEKMIRRHPHVFGNEQLESAEDVVKKWKEIKEIERFEKEKSKG
jgi:tetrapyrrole methylase family protein/MazG family protein